MVSQAASHHLRHELALSAASVAEPVEDILGNSSASPDVRGMSDNTLEARGDISLGQAGGEAADGAGSGCPAISGGRQDQQAAFISGAAAEDLGGTPPTALAGHEPHGPPPGSAEMAAGKAAVGAGGGCAAISGGRQDPQAGFLCGGAAGDLGGPPQAAVYVHEPYGPPPGAAEMQL